MGRRRSTFERVPELLLITPGLRVGALVTVLVIFAAGMFCGVVIGLAQ